MTDWPLNNWYANNRNTAGTDTATPARYYAWDGEWSMDRKKDTLVQGASVHPEFLPGATPASTIGKLWKAAWANPSFQALFHSRVTLHTAPGGALSDAAVTARYDALNNQVRDAVIGESIRWGDALSSIGQPTRTRDVDWQREVTALRALIAGNTARFISALRAEGYYPSTTPPAISPAPGLLTGNVTITNPNATGTILYTTDGSDPTVNPAALTYTTPISLSVSTTVRATVRIGTSFTPVTANTYILSSFSVTEINYNPAPASPAEIAAGFLTGDAFEYIEIRNNSSQPLNLANFAFITGVTTGPLTGTVAPNEVVVLVFNAAGFASRHGATARVVGTYTGTLSNGGEQVVATYPAGINAIDFVYDDIAPWPLTPDGTGPSLVALTTTGLSLPTNWAASGIVGGTPGFIPDTVAPSVVSVSPVDAATVTAAGLIPSVTFSEPVAAFASLALATEAGVPVATTNTIAGNTVSLTPATTLAVGTAFRITVPTTVTDIAGNALATAFTSTFTTATPPPADTTPPTVSAVAPTNAATGVAVGTIPAVTFSEPVTAITGIALAIDGGATVPTTATLTGNIVTLTPASPLAAGTTYRLTVPTTVTDIAGNALATAFTSTFTSVVVVTPPTTDILKVSRSTSRTPAVALTGNNWLPSEQVSVFLDTPQAAISVRFYLDTPTTGTPRRTEGAAPWDFNGGSITTANAFVNNLTAGTHIIRALLTRANGTTQTYESIFTVGTTPPPPDTTRPTIGGVNPTNAATSITVSVVPTVTFSEPVTRITVPTTVTDTAGNTLATAFTSTFTTVAAPPVDTTRPTVVSVNPTNAATNIAVGAVPTVTFSEPVTALAGITLAIDGGATVAAASGITGNTVTITPAALLAAGTTYRITAATTVTDIAGNTLAAAFTSTFTTAVVVPPTTDILKVSRSATRSPAVVLAGNTSARGEQLFIFLDTAQAAVSVRFYLDTPVTGVPRRTEGAAPWDFSGGNLTTATPFTNNLTVGTHTVRAVLTRANGTTQTYESTFTVT